MAIQPAEAGPSTTLEGRQPQYKLAHSLSGHSRAVTALRFSPDGRSLVSAGESVVEYKARGVLTCRRRRTRALLVHQFESRKGSR